MTMAAQVVSASRLVPALAIIWREGIVPMKTHERDRFAADGTPEITDAFASWLTGYRTRTERRSRLGWAMRRLRTASPREYDVMYRALSLGESAEATTSWLNARCERHGIPFRYTVADTLTIRAAAVHKILTWV